MTNELRIFVQKISKLPTLPHIAQEILSIVNDDTVPLTRLEEIIEKDPTIAGRILSFANSAFFGTSGPVTSVSSAIIRIGFNNVKYISLGVALMMLLSGKGAKAPLDSGSIYKHCIATALVGRLLAHDISLASSDDAFICGILHDIGLLALNSYYPDTYRPVVEACGRGMRLLDAEKKLLGFTHDEIGLWLSDSWGLPELIRDGISHHHCPSSAQRNKLLVSVVHIADYITSRYFFRVIEAQPGYELDRAALLAVGMSDARLESFVTCFDRSVFEDEVM